MIDPKQPSLFEKKKNMSASYVRTRIWQLCVTLSQSVALHRADAARATFAARRKKNPPKLERIARADSGTWRVSGASGHFGDGKSLAGDKKDKKTVAQ
jgi:hypothetical protein